MKLVDRPGNGEIAHGEKFLSNSALKILVRGNRVELRMSGEIEVGKSFQFYSRVVSDQVNAY